MKKKHPAIHRFILPILACALLYSPLIDSAAAATDATTGPTSGPDAADSDRFLVLYPGVPSEHEKAPAAAYFAANAALKARGPIDVAALISGKLPADTPGLGASIHVTEAWVRYDNDKYDPGDPIRSDKAYAKSLGFQDILAYPTFGTNDDIFMVPYPGAARDKLLVSELNHSVTSYEPIYPGDTLYLVANERNVTDLTPATGSTYRSLAIETKGSVYNQRGAKVNDVVFRVVENIRVYKDRSGIPSNPGFGDIWIGPNWFSRAEHIYTDQDWATIRDLWSKEKRRGPKPLYWEDVKVGDMPAWTVDGPIDVSVSPIKPWGMGAGGSRTLKSEISNPSVLKTMVRNDKDGIYRLANPGQATPPIPKDGDNADPAADGPKPGEIDTTMIHEGSIKRSPIVNYEGRDVAIRTIQNWMGDRGWLENIKWTIMGPRDLAGVGIVAPGHPQAEYFLDEVPAMKGKHVDTHGLTKDVYIVKSYVTKKYVLNGHFDADLVWWIETIDQHIVEEGKATVSLPTKSRHL